MLEKTFPFREIRKRDGRVVEFCPEKITQAIFKAAKAVGGENYRLAEELTVEVISFLREKNIPGLNPTVEEIQDVVEKVLIERGHAKTAKAYILYRDKRTRIRETKSDLMDVVKDILLEGGREEEADVSHSPAFKMHQIATTASEKYYLDNLLPEDLANAHRTGSLYIHDLGYYSKTVESFQLDFSEKFAPEFGFNDFPPTSASGDLFAMLFNLAAFMQKGQNDLFGELSLPAFERNLGGMIRKFKKTPDPGEIAGALKGFLSFLREMPSPSHGHVMKSSLQLGLDTSEFGREITRALLQDLRSCNLPGSHWPRFLFLLDEPINISPDAPNHDLYKLALKVAAQHENISLVFLDEDREEKEEPAAAPLYFSSGLCLSSSLPGQSGGALRGNIATVSLNLPRLALTARDKALFFVELDRLLRMGVRQLLHRFEVLSVLKRKDLPFLMGEKMYRGSEGLKPGGSILEALKSGLLTINFTGMPEAVRALLGDKARDSGEVLTLVREIVQQMNRRVAMFAREYELNIVLSGALSSPHLRHLTDMDRQEFGLVRGVTDRELYSPSFFLFQEDHGLQDKIELDSILKKTCSAGYSSRLFLLPGADQSGVEELLLQLRDAGLGHVTLQTLSRGLMP